MSKTLDFNKVTKQYLTIKLNDENNTTLMIGTPTKKVLEELLLLEGSLEGVQEDSAGLEEMDNLFYSCAKIMSHNKGGIKITKEMLEEIFDFEDIILFFRSYMNFISEVMGSKN